MVILTDLVTFLCALILTRN